MARDDHSRQENLNVPAELEDLQAALGALAPRGSGLDRDRLMYEAGRAAALAELSTPAPIYSAVAPIHPRTRTHWFWPTTAAASFLAAATLGIVLLIRPDARIEPPVASSQPPVTPEQSPEPTESSPLDIAANPVWPAFWIGSDSILGQRNRALELAARGLPFEATSGERGRPRANVTITDEPAMPATDSRSLMNHLLNENSRRKTSRPTGPTANQG